MNDHLNPGSFMSASTGGTNGVGPELQNLMSQSPNSGQGSPLNQSSQSLPTPAPQTAGIPQSLANNPQQMAQGAGTGMPVQQGAPELQIALNALAQYIKSHGNVHEANNDVPLKKAQASAMTPQPQGGQ